MSAASVIGTIGFVVLIFLGLRWLSHDFGREDIFKAVGFAVSITAIIFILTYLISI